MIETEQDFEFEDEYDSDGLREATQTASADVAQIRGLLRQSGEFFIEFFLGEELTSEVPQFHKEVWELLTSTSDARVLLAIPRDHAKTTLAKLCVVWYFLFTGHRFAVYLSNTNAIAINACKDIIQFMQSSNFVAVFGKIRMIKESETASLWIFELPLGNGKVKKCILRGVGAGQQMRGINIDNQRPDIAVVDDVEDNENTDSPTLQKKLDRWIFGPFIKALARQKKILWLGNMLQKTSLLARLSKNPKWNPVVFGALVRNNTTGELQPLWPERWPLAELIEDFQEYRSLSLLETWMCEMMNMPGHGENGFRADQINYRPIPSPDGITAAWLCIDPAFGETNANDDTSITVHVLPENGIPMVVAESTGKFREHEMFEEAFRLATYWNAWVWGIEATAAQKVLITLFNVLFITKGMPGGAELIPLIAGTGDPKVARISAWVSMMEKDEYAIFEGALNITTQLLEYDMSKRKQRDDLIDSCSYGPQMLAQYLGLMIAQFNGKMGVSQRAARFGRSVAGV